MQNHDEHMIDIAWPSYNLNVRVRLFEKQAPKLCNLIWQVLPFESIEVHSMVAGTMVYSPTPIVTTAVENPKLLTQLKPGDCTYANFSQNLSIIYGGMNEPLAHNHIARIIESDIPTMQIMGERIWGEMIKPYEKKKPVHVIYSRVE